MLLPTNDENGKPLPQAALADDPMDRTNMLDYSGRLRRFTPTELLALFGFPPTYEFPSEISLEHQYKLIGIITMKMLLMLIFLNIVDNPSVDIVKKLC